MNRVLNRYASLSIPAKAALWFVICNILQKGISTISVPIFTRLMSPEQYGVYQVFLSWQSLIAVFTSLNLYLGVFNNAMIKFSNDRDKYISSMQGLTALITAVVFIGYLLFRDFFNELLNMSTLLVSLLFLDLFFIPAMLFWAGRQRFEYTYKILVGVTLLKAVFNPLLGVIAVVLNDEKDIARIISIVLVEVIFGGAIALYQALRGKKLFVKEYWKYALVFNIPLLPHYLSGMVLNQADRIMISKMSGNTQVALYSVAYNIGMLMQLFTDAINSSFTPWMYTSLRNKKYTEIKSVVNMLLFLIAIFAIILMFFAPEVIAIFASDEYTEAIYVIPPVASSVYFIFAYVIFANIEFYYEEKRFVAIASLAAAILNIILNYIFIPIFGYYAAGYTTLLCYIIFSVSHYAFSCIVCDKHINGERIYDLRMFMLISLLVVSTAFGFNFLYKLTLVRYSLSVVLLLCLYIKRSWVIDAIKKIRNNTRETGH